MAKSVVKLCTLTGVVNQALDASDAPPSVNCKRVPFSFVLPLDCKPVGVKPEAKLIAVEVWMVITLVAVALCVKFGAVAMAFTVVVLLTVNGAVYLVDEVVG